MKADNSRKLAVFAVSRLHKGGWANLTIKSMFEDTSASKQEKAFASAIFYGTAERIVTLDYLLQPFLKQPIAKLDIEVRAVLETGLYQIKYMEIPPHAVVNEMVKIARAVKKSSAAGLVNAVLRKAGEAVLPDKFESELQRISVVYSVSQQVAKAIVSSLPLDYEEFFKASFRKKDFCIRVNTLKTSAEELVKKLEDSGFVCLETALENCFFVQNPAGLLDTEFFLEGHFHVQGLSSQYVCEVAKAQKGERVLDLCSAPGGKSATMAQGMQGGEGLVCGELRENRIPLINELFARLGIVGAEVLTNDAAVFNPSLGVFDKVLCDVPCSGLGVLASKPDLRYALGENFQELEALQLKIIRTAARYVKKGGRLIYSTCTLRKEENIDIVQAFLEESSNFVATTPSPLPQKAVINAGTATFLPHLTNSDGFFMAYLERL